MKRYYFVFYLILATLLSCESDLDLRVEDSKIIIDDPIDPIDGVTGLCSGANLTVNPTSVVHDQTWFYLNWTYTSNCGNIPINIALYRQNIFVKNIATVSISSSKYLWKLEPFPNYGGNTHLQLKLIAPSNPEGFQLLGTSSFFSIGTPGSFLPPPCTSLGWLDFAQDGSRTYFAGDVFKIKTPNCWINIPRVTVELYDAHFNGSFVLLENVENTQNTINVPIPSFIPSGGTYYIRFGIPNEPNPHLPMWWSNFNTLIKYIKPFTPTICNPSNLQHGDLTSVNWPTNAFVYSQVYIEIHKTGSPIQYYTVPNNGKFTFGVSSGSVIGTSGEYKVFVKSKYGGFGFFSPTFTVKYVGIIKGDYDNDKSNCSMNYI